MVIDCFINRLRNILETIHQQYDFSDDKKLEKFSKAFFPKQIKCKLLSIFHTSFALKISISLSSERYQTFFGKNLQKLFKNR